MLCHIYIIYSIRDKKKRTSFAKTNFLVIEETDHLIMISIFKAADHYLKVIIKAVVEYYEKKAVSKDYSAAFQSSCDKVL